jgi:DNA-binding NarL/FixJ family response regulator
MSLRFLIVDDHPLLRGAVRNYLETVGDTVRCEQAGSLHEALLVLAAGPRFDLVLLDLALPDTASVSGLDTLRTRHPELPVLVLSGVQDPVTVDRCLRAGASGFLPKTARIERLASAVRVVTDGGVYVPPELEPTIERSGWSRPVPRPGPVTDLRQLGLTDRQRDVLRLILRGLPNKLICRQLQLAEGTVKVHVSAVLRALGARNRTQAVLAANRMGLRLPD